MYREGNQCRISSLCHEATLPSWCASLNYFELRFFGVQSGMYKVNQHILFIYFVAPPFKMYMSLCHMLHLDYYMYHVGSYATNTSYDFVLLLHFSFFSFYITRLLKANMHTKLTQIGFILVSSSKQCKESPLLNLLIACLVESNRWTTPLILIRACGTNS